MAKGSTKRKKKPAIDARIAPTIEAQRHGDYVSAGMAFKRVPVIDTMRARKQLDEREYQALAFYRDQAALAERSPVKSCLDQRVSGAANDISLSGAIVSAILTTARIERELGSLASLARAVAVDDKSLSQWCVDRFGGRERYDGKGKLVAIVPAGEKKAVEIARLELKFAARRIAA